MDLKDKIAVFKGELADLEWKQDRWGNFKKKVIRNGKEVECRVKFKSTSVRVEQKTSNGDWANLSRVALYISKQSSMEGMLKNFNL